MGTEAVPMSEENERAVIDAVQEWERATGDDETEAAWESAEAVFLEVLGRKEFRAVLPGIRVLGGSFGHNDVWPAYKAAARGGGGRWPLARALAKYAEEAAVRAEDNDELTSWDGYVELASD